MPEKVTPESTNSKHTPGPWTHENGEITAQGAVVAQVMGTDDFPCCEEDIDAECKANAHLIAAAPEMLEALEAILSKPYMMHQEERQRAEAAIRKARGAA